MRSILLLLFLTLSTLSFADQSVYSDQLDGGWQDYGWATLNYASTTQPHSGTHCISVTPAAWQALFLHHTAFSTTGYTNLKFWIRGTAATTGSTLQVQGLLSGTAQQAYALPPLTTTWTLVSIPLSALGTSNKPDFDGLWIKDTTGAAQPTFFVDDISLTTPSPPSTVYLTADPSKLLYSVDGRMFGVNTAVWDNQLGLPITATYLTQAGAGFLRFPGGSLSDEYHWATNKSGSNPWTWATDFDHFAAIALQAKTQVVVTANYGSGTPDEAAAWVNYSNNIKKYGFKFWEIGNENYGTWETDQNAVAHDAFTYGQRTAQYWQKMKAADPTVKIGVVVEVREDTYVNNTSHPATNPRTHAVHNGWTPVLLSTLKSFGLTPDFVSYHYYAQGPGQEDDYTLLHSANNWQADVANLRQQLSDYLGTTVAAKTAILVTENNSVYTNPGKQSTSLVNALYFADSFGNAIQTEMRGFMWWDLRNGQETGNNNSSSLYGWRGYGDYGIISGSNDRYPTYYALKLLHFFAKAGDRVISSQSSYTDLPVYGVKHSDGSVSLLVINKSPTLKQFGVISLSNFAPKPYAPTWTYGVDQDRAAQTATGSSDVATASVSNAGTKFGYYFPPYSMTVFTLSPVATP